MYKKGSGKKSISRNYQNINCESNNSEWDYKYKEIKWGSIEDYVIGRKLGEGTFSQAYKGTCKKTGINVTIRKLIKDRPEKIKREISVLRRIKGSVNNAHIFDAVKEDDDQKYIIMHYYINDGVIKKDTPLSEVELKGYMLQLLNGLDEAHSRGVMHRDIKPSNIVVNRKRKRLKIIDWGMADFYHPYKEYHLRVGSYYYKAPELLLGMKQYDYSLDMWSFACLFAGFIFGDFPFVKGKDKSEVQLIRSISGLFGEGELWDYIEKYNLNGISEEKLKAIVTPSNKSNRIMSKAETPFKTVLALDLLQKTLKVDHQERLTAKEAMEHPYFDEVRKA
ncbi:protein kinase domain-containing protein [Oceanimonas smirnovii]|uniref:protein kinase domain-containing protein n=1 Tax=Oceanimonas smirnovii TaxID=264574 RepID=UPI003FD3F1A6